MYVFQGFDIKVWIKLCYCHVVPTYIYNISSNIAIIHSIAVHAKFYKDSYDISDTKLEEHK